MYLSDVCICMCKTGVFSWLCKDAFLHVKDGVFEVPGSILGRDNVEQRYRS